MEKYSIEEIWKALSGDLLAVPPKSLQDLASMVAAREDDIKRRALILSSEALQELVEDAERIKIALGDTSRDAQNISDEARDLMDTIDEVICSVQPRKQEG